MNTNEWQPIDTLSKLNRRAVLFCEMYSDGGCNYFVGKVDEDNGAFYGLLNYETQFPTHWMPLPEPPK